MPRYNHDRADGLCNPCDICRIELVLEQMGIEVLGTREDPLKWSKSDFITDLPDYIDIRPPEGILLQGTVDEMDTHRPRSIRGRHDRGAP